MKKELLEWIVKEILEDLELINKADDNLTFQATLECIKEYEKHLQNEKKKKKKRKEISIAYKQGQILNQFKESEEFIDILVNRLKMSKSKITFEINSYKLLKKHPLLKHSNKSMYYFKKNFWQIKPIYRINGDQFKSILMN